MDTGLNNSLAIASLQVCVCRCVNGNVGAPSLLEYSQVSRCLFRTALESEFIETLVLLDHFCIHTTTQSIHP